MKIFFTAEYDEEQLKPLYEMGEVVKDGWAIGLPKMQEEELMENPQTRTSSLQATTILPGQSLKMPQTSSSSPVPAPLRLTLIWPQQKNVVFLLSIHRDVIPTLLLR